MNRGSYSSWCTIYTTPKVSNISGDRFVVLFYRLADSGKVPRKMLRNIRQWMLKLGFTLIVCSLLLLITAQRIRGQANVLQLIPTEYDDVSYLRWSPDSRVLQFFSMETAPVTQAYVLSSGTLTLASSVLPKLSDEEFQFFNIYGENKPTNYAISADSRYVVYVDATPIPHGEGGEAIPDAYAFFLGDRQQRQKVPTGDQLARSLDAYWNTTSSAFIIIGFPATEGEALVAIPTRIVTNFITNLDVMVSRRFPKFVIAGRSYSVSTSIYHIADDGNSVLLKAYDLNSGEFIEDQTLSLINYNVATPSQSQLILPDATNVKAAQFRFGTADKLLLINEQGLIEFNTVTHQTRVIDPSLNSSWVYEAGFSPDGHWIAITHILDDDSTVQLFLGDVAQLITSAP